MPHAAASWDIRIPDQAGQAVPLFDAIASAAFDAALGLEMLGKDKELGGAEAVFASLADEVERLGKALEVFSVRGDL